MKWSLTVSGDESETKDVLERLVKAIGAYTKPELESHSESKYSPLRRYLLQQKDAGETMLELSLDSIQEIIGDNLPNSAYEYDAFWRDRSRNIGISILQSGWQIKSLKRDSNNKITKVRLHTPENISLAEPTETPSTLQNRHTALKQLFSLQLPVADWEQMEEEIIKGAIE